MCINILYLYDKIKIMIKRLLVICMVGALISCSSETSYSQSKDNKHFGAKINAKNAISYDEMLTQMQGKERLKTKVKAKVASVCQVKGCWMNVVSASPGKEMMFVKFKDYAFFMPKDLAGKEVVMEGEAFYETTPVDELKHYAEDEGQSQEKIDAIKDPKKELKFLATGVVLAD